MAERKRPTCPDCGPLNLNEQGLIIYHHCPRYSDGPVDGVEHLKEWN